MFPLNIKKGKFFQNSIYSSSTFIVQIGSTFLRIPLPFFFCFDEKD